MGSRRWFSGFGVVATAAAALAQDPGPPAESGGDADLRSHVRLLERRVAELERGEAARGGTLDELAARAPRSDLAAAIGTTRLTGYAELLSSWNFRHGGEVAGRRGDTLGFSQLRTGDSDENGFSFRNVRLAAERTLRADGSTGFRVQVDHGVAAQGENADPNFEGGETLALPEANLSWRAPFAPTDHLDVTVGRFRTWLGWETFESDQNWLVTRNPIAVFGTPVTHTGLRAVAPLGEKIEAGLAFVNGWDEVRDANDGKTGLARLASGPYDDFLSSTLQVVASYGAIEGVGAHQGDGRRLFEVIWNGKLAESTEFALDAIWGDMPGRSWHGAATYVRHHATDELVLAGRVGWYADESLGTDGARVVDVSLAVFHDVAKDVTIGLEYRHDFSRGDGTFLGASGGPSRSQDTLTASFLYRF